MAETSLQNQPESGAKRGKGRRFAAGKSGNPAGKPKGARSRTTMLAERLLEADAKDVVEAVLKAAKGGDMAAARIVLDRIAPVRRGRAIVLKLPKVETASDVGKALSAVIEAMGRGELTADEAGSVAAVLEIRRKAIETHDHGERLLEIEERLNAKDNNHGQSIRTAHSQGGSESPGGRATAQ